LNLLSFHDLSDLGRLLCKLTALCGWGSYTDHYKRDFPQLAMTDTPNPAPASTVTLSTSTSTSAMEVEEPPGTTEEAGGSEASLPPVPPHVYRWLLLKLQGMQVGGAGLGAGCAIQYNNNIVVFFSLHLTQFCWMSPRQQHF